MTTADRAKHRYHPNPSPALRERAARAEPVPGEGCAESVMDVIIYEDCCAIAPRRDTLTRLAVLGTLSRIAGEGRHDV